MSSVNSGVTGPKFTIFLHDRGIIYAVNAYIEVAISHSVSESQSQQIREVCHFSTKLVAMAVFFEMSKKGPDRSSAPKILSLGVKIVKIGPVDPEIIVLRAVIKKMEINASKIYSPLNKYVKSIYKMP